jgi:acetyl esterase
VPLDPVAAGFLEQLAAADMPPLNEMSPPDAREASAAFVELAGPGEEVDAVVDRTIPGPAGEIPVRIYTPKGAGSGAESSN